MNVDAEIHCPSIQDLIQRQARERPDATALVFEGRATSYHALVDVSNRIAHALVARGIQRGDRIAYLGRNTDRYFQLLLGAFKAGATVVPLNWRLSEDELAFVLADSAPCALFVGRECIETAKTLTRGVVSLRLLVSVEDGMSEWESFDSLLSEGVRVRPLPVITANAVVLILYTSGTTGRPKGAMLTHQSLLRSSSSAEPDPDWFRWDAGETALIAMPVFHIGGTGQGLRALRGGCRMVLLREFAVDRVLAAIAEFRVGKLFLVPSAMRAVIRSPLLVTLDISCLRCLLYGASPIPEEQLRECMQALNCGFVQMYGMTETSGTITALSPEDHTAGDAVRRQSAGRPLPGVSISILDAEGIAQLSGAVGEIAVRSAANMSGYWNNASATAEAFTKDGWLRTGDLGYIDADGYVFVVDRLKDMIISGGENIYPTEVERALAGHPDVADVAVVGVRSEQWGEAVKAFVVLRSGATASATSIIQLARGKIAGYKLPKLLEFVPVLPRNAAGKLMRRQLRDGSGESS